MDKAMFSDIQRNKQTFKNDCGNKFSTRQTV